MSTDKNSVFKKDDIFGLFTSPSHYYIPQTEKRLTQELLENCKNSFPINCIVGPSGSGLTALSFWVYESLPYETHEIVYLTKIPSTSRNWLVKSILTFFGRDIESDKTTTSLFKELLEETEEIRSEERKLLIIIDDPNVITSEFWRMEVEPLLSINSIQQYSFSFLLTFTEKTYEEINKLSSFHPSFCMNKSYLPESEVKPYLERRLLGTIFEKYKLADKDVNKIKQKASGHFGRINELSSVILNRIKSVIEPELKKEAELDESMSGKKDQKVSEKMKASISDKKAPQIQERRSENSNRRKTKAQTKAKKPEKTEKKVDLPADIELQVNSEDFTQVAAQEEPRNPQVISKAEVSTPQNKKDEHTVVASKELTQTKAKNPAKDMEKESQSDEDLVEQDDWDVLQSLLKSS